MCAFLRVPSHHEVTKSCGALVSRFKNQCSHRCPQYRDPVSTSLFFELAIDLRSRDDHFRNNRCYPIDSLATMFEQVGSMGFPYVYYAKTAIRSAVNTYSQINFPAWQAELWHIGDRAEDVTAIWMLNQRVFFEFEQVRQEGSRTRVSGDQCDSSAIRLVGSTSAGESHQRNHREQLTESGADADFCRAVP